METEKKYYFVSFEWDEGVFCSNIVLAECKEDVEEEYRKRGWCQVREVQPGELETARRKGMPVFELLHQERVTGITFEESLSMGDPITIYQYRPVQKEIAGVFVNGRVNRSSVPKGWHAYDIREADDGFCTIEPFVFVNHGASILLKEEIVFPEAGRLILMDDEETNKESADADYSF